ncbi:MAG: hypothetical protein ACOYI9_08680 [Candidatus Hydrogenedentales bacterium]
MDVWMFVLALVPNWKVGNQHGVGRSFPTFHPPHARSQLSSWERERWLELGTGTGVGLGSQLESWEPEGNEISRHRGFPTGKLGTRGRWLELGSQLESWEPEGGGWGWVPNWKVGNQHGGGWSWERERDNTRNFISQPLCYDALLHQHPIVRIDLMPTCHSERSEESPRAVSTLVRVDTTSTAGPL